jgi:protein-S-isoprenylcysteine O-methyltransferase Ste14
MFTSYVHHYLIFILIPMYVVWLLTDTRTVKQRVRYYTKRTVRVGAFWQAVFLLNLVNWSFFFPNVRFQSFIEIAGLTTVTIGIGIAIAAKLTMKNNWGIPEQHDIEKQNKLVTTGPFKLSRNPIYLGLLLACIGAGIANISIFLPLNIILYFRFKNVILKEEELLKKHFSKKYLEYMQKVPRFL